MFLEAGSPTERAMPARLQRINDLFRLLYLVERIKYRIANKRKVARLTIKTFLFVSSFVKRYVSFIVGIGIVEFL